MATVVFTVQVLFAQEIITPTEESEITAKEAIAEAVETIPIAEPVPVPEPALTPEPIAELPKPMSVAQALSSISLPSGCSEDFTNLFGKDGFDMAKFMKELPMDVAKVKLQLKSPFGKPKDSDKTSSGLSVGCVKALPESPTEIIFLLKDIGLKVGLSLATDAMTSVADNSIPTNVATKSDSGGGVFKNVVSIGLITGGLGAIIYGVKKNSDVAEYVDKRNGKAAVDAESSRNMSYGIGAALLAGGLIIYLVF